MMVAVKTGLLVVTNPKCIQSLLTQIREKVERVVYIQLLSTLNDPWDGKNSNPITTWPTYGRIIHSIYRQAATHCQDLDVKILLSGLKYKGTTKIRTQQPIDLIVFDRNYSENDRNNFIGNHIVNTAQSYSTINIENDKMTESTTQFESTTRNDDTIYNHTVLGGTFDRLHIAHKILLTETVLRAKHTVTVGITTTNMIKGKLLWELIENYEERLESVRNFLQDICPELEYNLVPIDDPYGPAITDPTMNIIIVSPETVNGAEKINKLRKENGLEVLKVLPIELIDEPINNSDYEKIEETKISSSTGRIRLLGTVVRPISYESNLPKTPYIIGLTGAVCTGKSGVTKWLQNLGVTVINCDQLGHKVYEPDRPCYTSLIETYGRQIIAANGQIDRKILGSIVFSDKDALNKLNALVWPAIYEEIGKAIEAAATSSIIVVEAAILCKASWGRRCHEIWTTVVPRNEQIERVKQRGFTEIEAIKRIDSQWTNSEYVSKANVVFCTLWSPEVTKQQVEKAWQLLQNRLPTT